MIDKPALSALVGRSPKAAQEDRGDLPLVSIVFPNTEHLPPIKSAAVDEFVQADECETAHSTGH